jgi:hypothetical protein
MPSGTHLWYVKCVTRQKCVSKLVKNTNARTYTHTHIHTQAHTDTHTRPKILYICCTNYKSHKGGQSERGLNMKPSGEYIIYTIVYSVYSIQYTSIYIIVIYIVYEYI